MGFPALGPFFGFTNDNVIAVRAGNGTFDQEQIVRLADLNHFEVLGGSPDLAHMPGHFHSAHDRSGKETLADGARAPMPAFGSVG